MYSSRVTKPSPSVSTEAKRESRPAFALASARLMRPSLSPSASSHQLPLPGLVCAALPDEADRVAYLWWLATGELRYPGDPSASDGVASSGPLASLRYTPLK